MRRARFLGDEMHHNVYAIDELSDSNPLEMILLTTNLTKAYSVAHYRSTSPWGNPDQWSDWRLNYQIPTGVFG
jgi:hypothetical protein